MVQLRHGEALLSEEEIANFESMYVKGVATEPPPNYDLEMSASLNRGIRRQAEREARALYRIRGRRFIG